MKKIPYIITIVMASLALAMCLNPIGVKPELKIGIDANVSGEISVVSADAAVIIQNHTNTVDITLVEITDSHIASIVGRVQNKPRAGFEKLFNLRPRTDREYEFKLEYRESNPSRRPPGADVTGWDFGPEKLVKNIALPVKGLYYLHFYRKADGSLDLTLDQAAYAENRNAHDNQNTKTDPDLGEEGSGSGFTEENQKKYGLVVVKNLTTIPVEQVRFAWYEDPRRILSGSDIGDAEKLFAMSPGPNAGTQRSILLGPNDWHLWLMYSVNGRQREFPVPPVTRVLTTLTGSIAYVYFYKSKGGYGISTEWPPLVTNPHDPDYPDDGNSNPNLILGDNEGLLEVINESAAATVQEVKWQGVSYGLQVLPRNRGTVVLPVNENADMSFRIGGKGAFGQIFKTSIKSRQTTTIVYTDGFENELPPSGGALIRLSNHCMYNDTDIEGLLIQDTDTGQQLDVANVEFEPAGPVGPHGGKALVRLNSSNLLPIVSGRQYLIKAFIRSPKYGNAVVRIKSDLYNRIVDISVSDSLIENNRANKGTIVIQNYSSARVEGLTVIDPAVNAAVSADYNDFIPQGIIGPGTASAASSAAYEVYSSATMSLLPNRAYDVRVYVERGGETAHLTKRRLFLYNTTQTLNITQADIDALEPGLPWDSGFVPVLNILGVPSDIVSKQPIDLSSRCVVYPPNASNKKIVWSVKEAGATGASITPGSILNAPNTGTLTLTATVEGGEAPGKAFTKDFTVSVINSVSPGVSVSGIKGIPEQINAGKIGIDSWPIAVQPSDATVKFPIQWSIENQGTTGARIEGNTLVATNGGTLRLKAVIKDGITTGTDFSQTFPIVVKLGEVMVRFLYAGNQGMSAHDNKGRWRVSAIEILRRPRSVDGYLVNDAGLAGVTGCGNLLKGYADVRWTGIHQNGQASPSDWAGKGNLLWFFGSTYRSRDNPKVSGSKGTDYIVDDSFYVYKQNADSNPNAIPSGPKEKSYKLPVKHPEDRDEYGGDTNRRSTVYWIRLGMDNHDPVVGQWWKGYDLNTYFALDLDKHLDKIDKDGVLTLYIYLYHIPYIDFWEGKGN